MNTTAADAGSAPAPAGSPTWADEVHAMLKAANLRHVGIVSDAGHLRLIRQEFRSLAKVA